MSSREEIREAIDTYTDDRCPYPDEACEYRAEYGYCISGDDAYKCLMKCLDKLGVVVKVESKEHESPECDWCYWDTHKVEPLIEEGSQNALQR